jgi:SAM-dependent methyltransferase
MIPDLINTQLAKSVEDVDAINKQFYGKYNYPWPPLILPAYPKDITRTFVNQDIGSWDHSRLPANARIWVAGCGTNQALLTALKFPESEILGTDISTQSLDTCRKNAAAIGIKNLRLEEKSLNDVTYLEEFDYVICTGVIHHNARPGNVLQNLRNALKPDGILELMVYNYYHRLFTVACQKAIRCFYDANAQVDFLLEQDLAKRMIAGYPANCNEDMERFFKEHIDMSEAEMTDSLIQPVEYNYTVESLAGLADKAGLEILLHCINQFDIDANTFTWNMQFNEPGLTEKYLALEDIKRWQVTNLVALTNSPMLWFYMQKKESSFPRKTEQQVAAEFLGTRFEKTSFYINNYVLGEQGYALDKEPLKRPVELRIKDPLLRKIYDLAQPDRTMREIFTALQLNTGFYEVNKARVLLTTFGYPFLRAVNTTV